MLPTNLADLRDKRCKLVNEPNAAGMVDDCIHQLLPLPSKATTDFDRASQERNGHVHHTGTPELFVMDATGKALVGQCVLRGQCVSPKLKALPIAHKALPSAVMFATTFFVNKKKNEHVRC